MTLALPAQLAKASLIDGDVASKVMLDLTVYLVGPSEQELDLLVDLYERIVPKGAMNQYSTDDILDWDEIDRPQLTASGRAAAAAGNKRPYLEPTRKRIREGRAFGLTIWDKREIDDPAGSWSLTCRRLHLRKTGLHAVVRILAPLGTDPNVLKDLAGSIADGVELHSGHGGLAFAYRPELKEAALDLIYAQARRFWGVDIEDLNATLPVAANGIKAVNWLTLVACRLLEVPTIETGIRGLEGIGVTVDQHVYAVLLIAGPEPVVGDQNRPDSSLDPYRAVARALEPIFLNDHPDFDGAKFLENGDTIKWIRRFIEPESWR